MKNIYLFICIILYSHASAEEISPITASIKNKRHIALTNGKNNGTDPKKIHYEQRDARKRTRVHHAAIAGDWVALDGYLAAGDDPNATDIYGNTPLHYVVKYDTNKSNRRKAIFTLLGFGADVYSRNNIGYSPTEYAQDVFFRRILLTFDQIAASVGPTLGDI